MSKFDDIVRALQPLFDPNTTAAGTSAPATSAECRQLMEERERASSTPAEFAQVREDNECLEMRAMFLEKQGL